MKEKFWFGLKIYLLLSWNVAIGQPTLRFEHYNQTEGLSQGTGYATAQYENYLWFGTQDGLNRYDGYVFKVYRANKNSKLFNSFVPALLTDSRNRLWIGTGNGINLYDPKEDNFISFNEAFAIKNPFEIGISIKKMFEDNHGNIWIISDNNGIVCFDPRLKTIKKHLPNESNVMSCIEDSEGNIWVNTSTKIFKLTNLTKDFEEVPIPYLASKKHYTLITMLIDKKQQLWLGTYAEGLCLFSIIKNKLVFKEQFKAGKGLLSSDITCMLQSSNRKLWVGTRTGGLSQYQETQNKFIHNTNSRNNPQSLADNHIWSLFEDQQQILWIGLSNRGYDKYDRHKFRFELLRKNHDDPSNSIPDNMIFRILGHKEHVFIGTYSGINILNTASNSIKPLFTDRTTISNDYFNEVRTMSLDKDQNLWMMNWQGILKYKWLSARRTNYYLDVDPSIYLYSSLYRKAQNQVWVGGANGLNIFDISLKQPKDITKTILAKTLTDKQIRVIHTDTNENIWVGTLGFGVYIYHPKTKKTYHFNSQMVCENIRSFLEDEDTIWVGSDCGLYKIDKKNMLVKKYYNKFPNNVIYSILQDNDGYLWIGTNAGLSKFSIQKEIVEVTYDENDGLQNNEFNTDCAYKSPDGTMYFGGVNGVTYFKPENITSNKFVSPIKITKIKVLDSLYNENVAELSLKHFQNFLEFQFVGFNYSNTPKNTYRYKLEGIDPTWVNSGRKNSANYTNLPPGKYVFKVKGSNNDGLENPAEAILTVVINPAYYQTWWFRVLLFFGTTGLLALFIRNNNTSRNLKISLAEGETKRLLKESEMKEKEMILLQKIAETEISALRSQMNPHFIFNCLNSIKLYSLENDSESASIYLTKFSKLIRLVLDNSRSERLTLEKEIETLQLYIEMEIMRFKEKVQYEMVISTEIDQQYVEIPPLLIQPFVENAIWHGLMHKEFGGKVSIMVNLVQEIMLEIQIIDNGVGRKKSAEYKSKTATNHKSFGMKVTNERIDLINQIYKTNAKVEIVDLYDEKEIGVGTKVIIQIPI